MAPVRRRRSVAPFGGRVSLGTARRDRPGDAPGPWSFAEHAVADTTVAVRRVSLGLLRLPGDAVEKSVSWLSRRPQRMMLAGAWRWCACARVRVCACMCVRDRTEAVDVPRLLPPPETTRRNLCGGAGSTGDIVSGWATDRLAATSKRSGPWVEHPYGRRRRLGRRGGQCVRARTRNGWSRNTTARGNSAIVLQRMQCDAGKIRNVRQRVECFVTRGPMRNGAGSHRSAGTKAGGRDRLSKGDEEGDETDEEEEKGVECKTAVAAAPSTSDSGSGSGSEFPRLAPLPSCSVVAAPSASSPL